MIASIWLIVDVTRLLDRPNNRTRFRDLRDMFSAIGICRKVHEPLSLAKRILVSRELGGETYCCCRPVHACAVSTPGLTKAVAYLSSLADHRSLVDLSFLEVLGRSSLALSPLVDHPLGDYDLVDSNLVDSDRPCR